MAREHDIFYGVQRKPDGSMFVDELGKFHTINGQCACVKCDEVWPCRAVLADEWVSRNDALLGYT